ncbi:CCA tRNA nucleotidyltransferase [Alteromonas stellipolaris]|jgi:tRNA nucleotidyltransferase (CCA-adding enzyme)|uniref:CCA tRNA nucleotidyltransferase n=1 Tax=Alteromonas stellipolaris TaxID=233316 RepID=UPI0026E2C2F7|nr:CCA tRNA nucleotidyltransferase [Alteromonas stellipolaris]MDO6537040.1 CCA tRNA nucleotidyltransferase [Alteromonas stellipolaris]MDP2595119.1 CCA tRNA nucleotidyltransferase [Alteromonas stellipolaris]
MQVYLVGGAVRDTLLGRTVTERDYVVVGATPAQMLAKGFTQVGKDFPVFLHPKTSEEYALARTERKMGSGYTGFECDASTSVTLEEDLKRRDLTVNAIARDQDGELIDPYHGQQDLQNKVLRHVSEAFSEDPLRVFRVARFATRYAYLGFTIAEETLSLMTAMAKSGELTSLSAERVWQETKRSLLEATPEVFFKTLKACHGLDDWFAELSESESAFDTGIQALQQIQTRTQPQNQGANYTASIEVRFAALCSGLSHKQVQQLCKRLKVQNTVSDIAEMVSEHKASLINNDKLEAETLLTVFNKTDAWRRPERFSLFLNALLPIALQFSDTKQTGTMNSSHWSERETLITQALVAANAVDVQHIIAQGFKGPEIREALNNAKLEKISALLC